LGKYLHVTDRKVLDSAYNAEIKVLEPRLAIKDRCARSDSRGGGSGRSAREKGQAAGVVDSRYLDEMEKSGFFDQLWGKK
jgi:hypothetical protein